MLDDIGDLVSVNQDLLKAAQHPRLRRLGTPQLALKRLPSWNLEEDAPAKKKGVDLDAPPIWPSLLFAPHMSLSVPLLRECPARPQHVIVPPEFRPGTLRRIRTRAEAEAAGYKVSPGSGAVPAAPGAQAAVEGPADALAAAAGEALVSKAPRPPPLEPVGSFSHPDAPQSECVDMSLDSSVTTPASSLAPPVPKPPPSDPFGFLATQRPTPSAPTQPAVPLTGADAPEAPAAKASRFSFQAPSGSDPKPPPQPMPFGPPSTASTATGAGPFGVGKTSPPFGSGPGSTSTKATPFGSDSAAPPTNGLPNPFAKPPVPAPASPSATPKKPFGFSPATSASAPDTPFGPKPGDATTAPSPFGTATPGGDKSAGTAGPFGIGSVPSNAATEKAGPGAGPFGAPQSGHGRSKRGRADEEDARGGEAQPPEPFGFGAVTPSASQDAPAGAGTAAVTPVRDDDDVESDRKKKRAARFAFGGDAGLCRVSLGGPWGSEVVG